MVKFKPGIPTGFNLDVEPVHDLGDYLDEPGPKPLPSRGPKESRSTPESPAVMPTPTRPVETTEPAMVTTAVVQTTEPHPFTPMQSVQEPTPRQEPVARSKAPRREISMTPDTLRMSDELLELVRGGSGQRDTKANELFHALVLLAYEVRGELDVHTIPKRGQWGTPTARAYPPGNTKRFPPGDPQEVRRGFRESERVAVPGKQRGMTGGENRSPRADIFGGSR